MACEHNTLVEKCTCPKVECPRHGKCCECVIYHREEKKNIPLCLREL